MARTRWLAVVLVLVASSCVDSGGAADTADAAQVAPNPTYQLCRSFLYEEPLDRPLANFVVYHWSALHPWVRTAADDYASEATALHVEELERQCLSFLALLER